MLLLLLVLAAKPAAQPPAQNGVPPAAMPRYQDAVAKLGARQYGPANDVLNSLAADYPRVAEIFASRCSAQLGLQHYPAAEADCRYTLALKPLATAVYGLAVAEDGQGKYPAAAAHYRQYAANAEALPALRQQALDRAAVIATPVAVAPTPEPVVAVKAPEPDVAPPPPPPPAPGGRKGEFVPGIPDSNEGLLYVYRNMLSGLGSVGTVSVDNVRVGELWNDHYLELKLRPGSHTVSIKTAVSNVEHALPVEISEGAVAYLKLQFENDGFKLVPIGKEGRKEIREDCELTASKKL